MKKVDTMIASSLPASRPRGFERPVSLSEVLDRVLNTGAVVSGEVVISLADVDLLYLGLNVVLTSVETARKNKSQTRESHVNS